MSLRSRSRYVPNVATWRSAKGNLPNTDDFGVFWDSSSSGDGTFDPGASSTMRFDRFIDETIYDESSGVGNYNTVNHVKREAATISGKIGYTYSGWTPSCLDVALKGCVMYNVVPTLPAPNWGGLVDQLAQQVQGRSGPSCMLLLMLKELGQTVQMVRNPFSLLKRDWRKVVKHHPAAELAKKGANIWLEQLFGWQSLFRDIGSLAEAAGSTMIEIANLDRAEGETWTRYRSVSKDTGTLPNVYGLNTPSETNWRDLLSDNGLNYATFGVKLSNLRWTRISAVTCRTSSYYNRVLGLTSRLLQGMDANTWHGVRDFLWEVVPFSFVVDWFVDTRGIWAPTNQAMISAAGADWIGHSTKTELTYDAAVAVGTWPAAFTGQLSGFWHRYASSSSSRVFSSQSQGRIIQFTRTPGWPPSDAPLYFRGWGLNLTQLATTAALICQKAVK